MAALRCAMRAACSPSLLAPSSRLVAAAANSCLRHLRHGQVIRTAAASRGSATATAITASGSAGRRTRKLDTPKRALYTAASRSTSHSIGAQQLVLQARQELSSLHLGKPPPPFRPPCPSALPNKEDVVASVLSRMLAYSALMSARCSMLARLFGTSVEPALESHSKEWCEEGLTAEMRAARYLGNYDFGGRRIRRASDMRLLVLGRSDILAAMGIDPEEFWGYDIDHIIPKSLAGLNHPANYVVMLRRANRHFGWCISSEKLWYVGWDAVQGAAKHYRKVHSSLIGQRSCRLP